MTLSKTTVFHVPLKVRVSMLFYILNEPILSSNPQVGATLKLASENKMTAKTTHREFNAKRKPQNKTLPETSSNAACKKEIKTFLFVLADVTASFRKRPKSTVDSPRERINLCRPSVLASSPSFGTLQLKEGQTSQQNNHYAA